MFQAEQLKDRQCLAIKNFGHSYQPTLSPGTALYQYVTTVYIDVAKDGVCNTSRIAAHEHV